MCFINVGKYKFYRSSGHEGSWAHSSHVFGPTLGTGADTDLCDQVPGLKALLASVGT